jgi:hypothetical protein
MPEQNSGTSEVEHAEKVLDVTFPTGDEPPEIVKPGEEVRDGDIARLWDSGSRSRLPIRDQTIQALAWRSRGKTSHR